MFFALVSPTITHTHSYKVSTELTDGLSLSDSANIAQVVIAIANIALAIYIFSHQINQGKKSDQKNDDQTLKSIKLQWFKELIIQPKIKNLDVFIGDLKNVKSLITSTHLNTNDVVMINDYIKQKAYNYKIDFYDVIRNINSDMYLKLRREAELVVDKMTTAFSDNNFNFLDPQIFENVILNPIKACNDNTIAIILSYKGE